MSIKRKIKKWIYSDVTYENGKPYPRFKPNEGIKTIEDYKKSAQEQIDDIEKLYSLDQKSILDFGCGKGRIASYLQFNKQDIKSYMGIDINHENIEWCKKHLENSKFHFLKSNTKNLRYNPSGVQKGHPVITNQFDIIIASSVFSHLDPDGIRMELEWMKACTNEQSIVYFTAFIENNVPDFEENPNNYIGKPSGPLHRVRYDFTFFQSLVKNAGWKLIRFDHGKIKRTGQSRGFLTWANEVV